MHPEEIDHLCKGSAYLDPPQVIVGNGHGLRRCSFDLLDVCNDALERNHVVIPVHERLVTDIDRHDDVFIVVREFDSAADLDTIGNCIGGEFLLGDGLFKPGATLVIAELGIEPDAEQYLDRQIVFADQLESGNGIFLGIVQADKVKLMLYQDLQVSQYLFPARVNGTVTAVGVLPLAKTRIGHSHDLALQEGVGFLGVGCPGSTLVVRR